MYTDTNGQNYLLWSTHLDPSDGNTYAQLATKFTTLGSKLNLKSASMTLQEDNGGHGMIFQAEGKLYLTFHSPNQKGFERPAFTEITDTGDCVSIKR